jgi:DNA-binding response OmpR family regulator
MALRYHHPAPGTGPQGPGQRAHLNLLVSFGARSDGSTAEQLSRLLEPLGIESFTAGSGEEAADLIRRIAIHIAIVDLELPLASGAADAVRRDTGGGRILQLLRRQTHPPPTVIVRPPQPAVRDSVRGLSEALREGAFAVVDRPLHIETLLEIMRRIVRRHYAGHWPSCAPPARRPPQAG